MSKTRFPLLTSLRSFEAAARHRSIKKASIELHVSHAAVSRHIHKVEMQLGRLLFDRTKRKLALNDDGRFLSGAVTAAFAHIYHALAQLSESQNPDRLVISVDPDFAVLWLVPRLADFYARVPNILVEIVSERNLRSLDDPRISCSIQYAEAAEYFDNGEMLFRSRLFPVCTPNVMQSRPLNVPEDLRCHRLLHDRSIDEWELYFRSCGAGVDINVRSGDVFSETALCLDAAARGHGVAMGDDFLAAMHLSEGRLVKPFESAVASKNAYFFLVAADLPRHPAVEAFRTWLRQSVDGDGKRT